MDTIVSLPASADVKPLLNEIVRSAQSVYDAWSQDEEGLDEVYGAGGVCDDIASEIAAVLSRGLGIDAYTQYVEMDCHTLVIAAFSDGVFSIDIPSRVYERGTGYCWTKIDNVVFGPDDILIVSLAPDPSRLCEFVDADLDLQNGIDDEVSGLSP